MEYFEYTNPDDTILFIQSKKDWTFKDKFNYIITTQFIDNNHIQLIAPEIACVFEKLFNEKINGCYRCLEKYINVIKQKGPELMEKYELAQNRTCKPKFKSAIYFAAPFNRYILPNLLSDAEATELLKLGFLKESDFEVMPEVQKLSKKKTKTKINEDLS